jgi:hypothetical protein
LACSSCTRWLLENKVVKLGIVDRASDSTIGRTLKKTLSNRIGGSAGSFRRRRTARSFVAAMEDVHAAARSRLPLVCLDETSKQLPETRVPILMKAGRSARFDYKYERNGTANLFMMFAPLEGWRRVKVTERHTAVDYAHVLKDLADILALGQSSGPG